MLNELIRRLFAACGVVFRMIRAFFTRQFQAIVARVKSATSLTRQASKAAPALLKKATDVGKKPSKREDYIETKQMFISKSFLITVILVIVIVAALIYFLIWPWLLSRFFTAKFWCEDPKTESYTGRVILYYEKEKDNIKFKGRLEEGVIQGKGESYDKNGLLIYSGDYVDGVYSGEGKLYDAGNLVYEGTFLQGLYDGEGKLYDAGDLVYEGTFLQGLYDGEGKLYDEGNLLYKGMFAQGLYDGEGTLYEKNGKLLYVGKFSAGIRSGEGTAYQNGKRIYKGGFADDLYNGDGILYDSAVGIRYRGSFIDGLYSGSGVLTLDTGATVQAEFEQGEVIGDAKCFMGGKLYYEGSLRQLVPDGMGTLYSASGKALYSGPMKYGVIDGGALLETSAADLRDMLEERAEQSYDQGFVISCEALGFAALCSYAGEDADPMVYRVYLYAPKDNRPLASLLWDSPEEFEDLAQQDEPRPGRTAGGTAAPGFSISLPVELGQKAYCQPYLYDGGYSLNLWSRLGEEAPSLLEWRLGRELPAVTGDKEETSDSAARLDALIAGLGLVSDRLSSDGNGKPGGAGGGQTSQKKDGGATLLKAVKEDGNVHAVLRAALSYLEYEELRAAAQENLELYKEMAEEEKALISSGKGDAERLADLEDQIAQFDVLIAKYAAQIRKDSRTVEDATGLKVSDYDVSDLLVFFEVGKLDMNALGDAVIAAAEEAARKKAEEEAAKRWEEQLAEWEQAMAEAEEGEEIPPPEKEEIVVPPVDKRALLETLEDNILDLELAHQDVQLALRSYENALSDVEQVRARYAVGEATKAEIQGAQITANNRRGLLYSAMISFTRQASILDESAGGALAKDQKWLTGILAK